MAGTDSTYSAGQRDSVPAALARAVAERPDAIFVDIDGDRLSFAEADRLSTRFANRLSQLGLSKGDCLVTLCETGVDPLVAWLATAKLGAIWVPINLAYRREFLRHQICDTGARILLCDPAYLDRIVEIADQLPLVERVLCRGDGTELVGSLRVDPLDHGEDDRPLAVDVAPSDIAMLLYTSGTTGPSKGCMLSHNCLGMWGRQQQRAIGLAPGKNILAPLPLFHSAAISTLMSGIIAQASVVLPRKFSVTSFWADVERSGATHLFLMATMFPLLAFAPDDAAMKRCFGQVELLMGVPCPPDIRRIFEQRFGVAHVLPAMYGQTEALRLTMVTLGQEAPDHSIGPAADEFDLAILDANDCPVPPGAVGEICCRPRHPNIMFEGYWNRPEETAKVWRNLWMHTGDLGRRDEAGFFYFVDRAKDYLRSRGENVSSFEVEQTFLGHPAILEAALHPASPGVVEDDIKITLVLKAEAALTEQELCLWAIDNLPYFAVPRYYEFRRELVKNPTGRVLKYKLREEGVTPTTWDREAAGIRVGRSSRAPQTARAS